MAFKPEEVSSVLEQELEQYESRLKMESVGTVLQVGDGIARTEKEAFLQKQFKSKTNPNVYGLLVLLLRRRRFDHLVAIAGEFHKLAEEAQGITRAVVRTAVPITDGQADVLTRALGKRTGSKKVLLTREVDPALLGGASLSLDHKVIDGTLATQLWRLRRQLRDTRV